MSDVMSKPAPVIAEDPPAEIGDSELLGMCCCAVMGFEEDVGADLASLSGLQAGTPPTLLDCPGLCDRVQYHGPPAVNRVYALLFGSCRPGGHGLGNYLWDVVG